MIGYFSWREIRAFGVAVTCGLVFLLLQNTIAHAADTLFSQGSASVTRLATSTSAVIDASAHENLELSFAYEAESLDNGDIFTFGWSSGGVKNDLGTILGSNETGEDKDTDETGFVSQSLPELAQVADLQLYFELLANTDSDTVNLTFITLAGDLVEEGGGSKAAATSTLSGSVFNDDNVTNGIFDETETAIPDWEVFATNAASSTTLAATTSVNGFYSFEITPGDWEISHTLQEGFSESNLDGDCSVTALTAGGDTFLCDIGVLATTTATSTDDEDENEDDENDGGGGGGNDDDDTEEEENEPVIYGPYCGDGEVNQHWEVCDGGLQCTAQCTSKLQCSELPLAKIKLDPVTEPQHSFNGALYVGQTENPIPSNAWFLLEQSTKPANKVANQTNGLGVAYDETTGVVTVALRGGGNNNNRDTANGFMRLRGVRATGISPQISFTSYDLDLEGKVPDSLTKDSNTKVSFEMSAAGGKDGFTINTKDAKNPHTCPSCLAGVEARVVLLEGGVANVGDGNVSEVVQLGDGSSVYFDEWFPLFDSDSKSYIVDDLSVKQFEDPGSLEGLFVSRRGDGEVEVRLYGTHEKVDGAVTGREYVNARLEIRDASFKTDSLETTTLETHGETGFDEVIVEETGVDMHLRVGTGNDTFSVLVDHFSIEACAEDDIPVPADMYTIAGYKWYDTNKNGIWEEEENGIENWPIYVFENDGDAVYSLYTNETGYYETTVSAGSWRVAEALPDGWVQTYPSALDFTLGIATVEIDNGDGDVVIDDVVVEIDEEEEQTVGDVVLIDNQSVQLGSGVCAVTFGDGVIAIPLPDDFGKNPDGITISAARMQNDRDSFVCNFGNYEIETEDDTATSTATSTEETDSGNGITTGTRISSASGRREDSTPAGQVLGVSTSCTAPLTDYMKSGWANDPLQVQILQQFLLARGHVLGVTGVYDAQTAAAVEQYQLAHADEILQPWVDAGLFSDLAPTDFVFKLTRWHINNAICEGSETYPDLGT